MKKMKKVTALILILVFVIAASGATFADTTITHQHDMIVSNVSYGMSQETHRYMAYITLGGFEWMVWNTCYYLCSETYTMYHCRYCNYGYVSTTHHAVPGTHSGCGG